MVSAFIPTTFIVRHGERLDHTDKLWQPDPSLGIWDPPITSKGFKQAEKTGSTIIEMIHKQNIDIKNTNIIIYSSPFQRCIDTSIGIIKGIQQKSSSNTPPTLRVDIGLGEWMCERFFDYVCPAQHLLSRQQEKLARRQAYSYSILAKKNKLLTEQERNELLPPLIIDYSYDNLNYSEFDYPERYTDMIHRFEDTRLNCLENASITVNSSKKKKMVVVSTNNEEQQSSAAATVVVIFVTHAVGVNALLDGFRNRVTIPLESNYCSISCVRRPNNNNNTVADLSDQSDDDCEYMEGEDDNNNSGSNSPLKSKWVIDALMYDRHLST